MQSLWDDGEAAQFGGELGQRIYTSRLLGRDKTLVLHGGGNTSVKMVEKNLFGENQNVLYIKGSGRDLETIDAAGFVPAVAGSCAAAGATGDLVRRRSWRTSWLSAR